MYKLDSNEYNFEHSAEVHTVLLDHKYMKYYQNDASLESELRERIICNEGFAGVRSDDISFVPGSDAGLDMMCRLVSRRGYVYVLAPTYSNFTALAENRATVIGVRHNPGDNFDCAEIMCELVRRNPPTAKSLVYICNPNNPTGLEWTLSGIKQVCEFTRNLPITVLVDEAYIEFTELQTAAPLTAEYPHVAVSRTFSKAYGLAGLRIGYLVAGEQLRRHFTILPHTTSEIAKKCALAVHRSVGHYRATAEDMHSNKEWFMRELRAADINVTGTNANWVIVDRQLQPGHARDLHDYGLHGMSRITIGTREQMEGVLREITADNRTVRRPPVTCLTDYRKKHSVYHLVELVSRVLNRLHVRYWADSGTLLGMMRDGEMVPWDDDADLGFVNTNPNGGEAWSEIQEALEMEGLYVRRNRYDTYWCVYWDDQRDYFAAPHVDMFPFILVNTGSDSEGETGERYVNIDTRFRTPDMTLCNFTYRVEELFPTYLARFGDSCVNMMLPVPSCAPRNLESLGDWRWTARIKGQTDTFTLHTQRYGNIAEPQFMQHMALRTAEYLRLRDYVEWSWLSDVRKAADRVMDIIHKHAPKDGITASGRLTAVVLDIDETILQNAKYAELTDLAFSEPADRERDTGNVLPGAVEIADLCRERNILLYLVTGRHEHLRRVTELNLREAGIRYTALYMMPDDPAKRPHVQGFKTRTRARIAQTCDILLTAGDQMSDIVGGWARFMVKYPHLYLTK